MRVKKGIAVSKEPILKKVVKSKRKISTPKAGVSLEKAVENVQQIIKKKNTEIKTKKKSSLTESNLKSKSTSKPTPKLASKSVPKLVSKSTSKLASKSVPKLVSKSTSKLTSKSKSKPKSTLQPTSKPIHKRKLSKKEIPKDGGIVYVGHIPHGFYEEQMKDYFTQFGKVTRTRVARSKRTGRSRGYGYVEFMHKEVAKIAAETMNNYLMCGRLLKATYIPPEKQHNGYFLGTNWSEKDYPRLKNRQNVTSKRNNIQNEEDYKNYVKSSLSKLSALESILEAKGISIKFQPVDVPSL